MLDGGMFQSRGRLFHNSRYLHSFFPPLLSEQFHSWVCGR